MTEVRVYKARVWCILLMGRWKHGCYDEVMRLGFLRKRGRLETLGRSNGVAEVLDLTTRGLTMVEPEFEAERGPGTRVVSRTGSNGDREVDEVDTVFELRRIRTVWQSFPA